MGTIAVVLALLLVVLVAMLLFAADRRGPGRVSMRASASRWFSFEFHFEDDTTSTQRRAPGPLVVDATPLPNVKPTPVAIEPREGRAIEGPSRSGRHRHRRR